MSSMDAVLKATIKAIPIAVYGTEKMRTVPKSITP